MRRTATDISQKAHPLLSGAPPGKTSRTALISKSIRKLKGSVDK